MAPGSDPSALFQSLSDPIRLRLLRLVGREELNVQELVRITGLGQPRVSRHLAILRDQGWLIQRREGTFSWYRLVAPEAFAHGPNLFAQLLRAADGVDGAAGDDALLATVVAERRRRADDFFADLADRWDGIRREYEHPDIALGALAALVDPGLRVLDIGTGTGAMLPVLGTAAGCVVALDHSRAMLDRADAVRRGEGLATVTLCNGTVEALPFGAGVFDACHCAMALHHVGDPAAAIREMARVVVPGGRVLATAFCAHDETWMREELGHRWPGFPRERIEDLFRRAGLVPRRWLVRSRRAPQAGDRRAPLGGRRPRWPDVFLAIATKPGV